MRRIYKYKIPHQDRSTLDLPVGATIRYVGVQNEQIYLWAEIHTWQKSTEKRHIRMVGTGHAILEKLEYLGSVMLCSGALVYHVYEIIKT